MNRQELIRRVDRGSRVRKHRDVSGFHSRMGLKMTLRWLEPDTWAAEYGDDYYD